MMKVDNRKLTPPYVCYLACLIRPFPNWDFFFIKSLRQKAVESLQLEARSRVIDAGCGPGGTFPYLIGVVGPLGEVVGVEISSEASINARKRIKANHWKNVHLVVGDARTVQLAGMFDGLVMFAAPDVYASPEAIANLFAYLKPDARIIIFGAKLSRRRLGVLPNSVLQVLMIENRMALLHIKEYVLGCMFLAWGPIVFTAPNGPRSKGKIRPTRWLSLFRQATISDLSNGCVYTHASSSLEAHSSASTLHYRIFSLDCFKPAMPQDHWFTSGQAN
jgi:SAM-dependent methyltransferase